MLQRIEMDAHGISSYVPPRPIPFPTSTLIPEDHICRSTRADLVEVPAQVNKAKAGEEEVSNTSHESSRPEKKVETSEDYLSRMSAWYCMILARRTHAF